MKRKTTNNLPNIFWGAETLEKRGVIISGYSNSVKNVIGAPFGSYAVYRGLGHAVGKLTYDFMPKLPDSLKAFSEKTPPAWQDPLKIVTLDPWGSLSANIIKDYLAKGFKPYSSIASCNATLVLPEIIDEIKQGSLQLDQHILKDNGVNVSKFAIDPVWYLPGIAHRLNITESSLRNELYKATAENFSELINNENLKVFLPPVGGTTIYCVGDIKKIKNSNTIIGVRIHDECNSSDVFGSTICTCRPYLIFSLIEMIKIAQKGGIGILIYNRQEGKAFGEVGKFLVYEARENTSIGNDPKHYYKFTEDFHQAHDLRFHEFCSDYIQWLGIEKIDYFYSMSPTKYQSLTKSGIIVRNRVPLPEGYIPNNANAEITAKRAFGGYY